MLFSLPKFFAVATLFSLGVSFANADAAQCANETLALRLDPDIDAVYDAAYEGTLNLVDPLTCGDDSCTFNFADASSNFESVCGTQGGQYVLGTITTTCDVQNAGTVEYTLVGFPNCIGTSCGTEETANEIETAANEFAAQLNAISGISNCKVKAENSASRSVGSFALIFGIGSTLLASMLL